MSWLDETWNADSTQGRSQIMLFLDEVGDRDHNSGIEYVKPSPEWFWIKGVFISTCDSSDGPEIKDQEAAAFTAGPPDGIRICLPSRRDGLGWGSGEHPATRLLCCWLQTPAIRAVLCEATRLCDYGSGSGIQALLACSISARIFAFGVEIEPSAVEGANANARANGLDDRCKFFLPSASVLQDDESFKERFGDLSSLPASLLPDDASPFDVVIANVWPGVQCAMAPVIRSLLKPGGTIAISGLQENRADDVIAAYEGLGIDLHIASKDRNGGGWALLSNLSL